MVPARMVDRGVADNRPIIVVAPFSPEGSGTNQHLGAANKIRAVLRILSRSGRRIILLNSAHNGQRFARTRTERFDIAGYPVESISAFTLPIRQAGKLANLLAAPYYAARLTKENPALVWIYNAYAFDAAVGLRMARSSGCPMVLELEDWPTARSRGANPKPYIDLAYFRKVLRRASLVTCVNDAVRHRIAAEGVPSMLLPGTLAPQLFTAGAAKAPFAGTRFTLGYFGGLTAEKGADILLAIVADLPDEWDLVVTGSGELRSEFAERARNSRRLRFFENLSAEEFYPILLGCDALVNPHRPIGPMQDGVFPFKVLEALASERLLISTPLPDCGVDLGCAVLFDGTSHGLIDALRGAKASFAERAQSIRNVATDVCRRFSDGAVYEALAAEIPALSRTARKIDP